MARTTKVNKTTDEAKKAIIENSVLGSGVPINPVGNAIDMKKRFVNPIVNSDGAASAIGEIDRVAQETETAFGEVDADIGKLQEDTTRLFGAVTTQSATNEAQNQAIQDLQNGKLDKTGGTMSGPLTVKAQKGVFVTIDGENGTDYADGRIRSLGKQYTFPQKEGALVSAQEAVGSVHFGIDGDNNLNLRLYDAAGSFLANYSVSLPVDNVVVSGYYDEATSTIALTLKSGNVVRVPVGALVNGLISSSEKGVPNGVASLDAEGKVPKEQLPDDIGGGGESADLSEYVKKTDYASDTKAGVFFINKYGFHGVSMIDNGTKLSIVKATNSEIDAKSSEFKPIVPETQDHAWKVSATTNTETFTDEEKAAACETIGALKARTDKGVIPMVYIKNTDGTQGSLLLVSEWDDASSGVPKYFSGRDENGNLVYMQLSVNPIPTRRDSATSKEYVDGKYAELLARIEALENK